MEAYDPEKLARIPKLERRWSWIEIDLGAIKHNTQEIRRLIGPHCHLMAVLKADGYGHGALRVAQAALNAGADYLGVATIDEAIELREGYINAPILILSEPPATAIDLLLAYKIMPSIYTPDFAIQYAEKADERGLRAPFHLAINTGMNRIGVRWDEAAQFMRNINFHRALELKGTFTHFATADCPENMDFKVQFSRFNEALAALRESGVKPGIVHCANSAATIRFPETHMDMVRVGLALYGYHPCRETYNLINLRPAMSVYARITDERVPAISEGVSYGLHYRCSGSVKICTVPIGYADGLHRGLSGNIDFLVDGVMCHQVGNICMDQCMFEVDMRTYAARKNIDPHIGDKVVIVGQEGPFAITIDEIANKLNTIPYEITIGFANRMPRIYIS